MAPGIQLCLSVLDAFDGVQVMDEKMMEMEKKKKKRRRRGREGEEKKWMRQRGNDYRYLNPRNQLLCIRCRRSLRDTVPAILGK